MLRNFFHRLNSILSKWVGFIHILRHWWKSSLINLRILINFILKISLNFQFSSLRCAFEDNEMKFLYDVNLKEFLKLSCKIHSHALKSICIQHRCCSLTSSSSEEMLIIFFTRFPLINAGLWYGSWITWFSAMTSSRRGEKVRIKNEDNEDLKIH